MTEAYMQLVNQVASVRQTWRFRRAFEGLLRALAVAGAALLLAVMADHLFAFSGPVRLVAALLVYGVAAGSLAWVIKPLTARHPDDYYAALIEQRNPESGNRVINALQLGRETDTGAGRLVEAIVRQGASAIEELDLRRVVASPALRRNGAILAGVLAVGLLYAALGGPAASTSFARVLMPGAEIAPWTWTKLSVEPAEPQRLLEGEPLTIEAEATDRQGAAPPEEATLHWTTQQGRQRSVRMDRTGEGRFTHTFASVEAGLTYHVAAGDAVSAPVPVRVDDRPRIESMSVTYHRPEYTAMEPRTVERFDGHMRALPGTAAELTVRTNKDLARLTLQRAGAEEPTSMRSGDDARTWQTRLKLTEPGSYKLTLLDKQGYKVQSPATYTISLKNDAPPTITFTNPGRDVQVRPDSKVTFAVKAQDRYGLGPVRILLQKGQNKEPQELKAWPNEGEPKTAAELSVTKTVKALGLAGGDHARFWAVAKDRNDVTGPGSSETRKFHMFVLTPDQAKKVVARQLSDYTKVVRELLRLQRQNRKQTDALNDPPKLADRQSRIRRKSLQLAQVMADNAFPAQSMIEQLRTLANNPMAEALSLLEAARDADKRSRRKTLAGDSLPVQDKIIKELEKMLSRLEKNQRKRQRLKRLEEESPEEHKEVESSLQKLSKDLDEFLSDMKELNKTYERMPKHREDPAKGEQRADLPDAEERLDKWKKWKKGTVDQLAKLPEGFVDTDHLAESVGKIFEEIEKKAKGETKEIAVDATPPGDQPPGMEASERVAEDLEMWMPHSGDSTKWAMDDPPAGKMEVPETTLPSKMQDMIGDLVEDMSELDEQADDMTGSFGGNIQPGWTVDDGPISSFGATGKTGNRLPNASEITGRSGPGRRGKATGQAVGSENPALEGRPTPARVTNEPYEKGTIESDKTLNPRGATGGGKKTGGGQKGLQGGTPPDFVDDMERLEKMHEQLLQRTQTVADKVEVSGRASQRVHRALDLLKSSGQALRDRRYRDAAKKRKTAINELRAAEANIDQSVNMALEKAPNLPEDMRQQIGSASQRALPEGYEDIVGDYYKALSNAGAETGGSQE